MANFITSFQTTILGNEGGYNPGIGEKETYMGIDRGANPHWDGWKIIDNIKTASPGITTSKMNGLLSADENLQKNIHTFYKENYWDGLKLDSVTDQTLANNLFDCSVNQGSGLAKKFMQLACNLIIETIQENLIPLIIDHIIGALTLKTFNSLPPDKLNTQINDLRLNSYKKDKQYAQWHAVWEKRLVKYT